MYWVNNGQRRWVACEAALTYLGSFPDVIEVSATIMTARRSLRVRLHQRLSVHGLLDLPELAAIEPRLVGRVPARHDHRRAVGAAPAPGLRRATASGSRWIIAGGSLSGTNTEDWVKVSLEHEHVAVVPVELRDRRQPRLPRHPGWGAAADLLELRDLAYVQEHGRLGRAIVGHDHRLPVGMPGRKLERLRQRLLAAPFRRPSGSGPRSVTVSWGQNATRRRARVRDDRGADVHGAQGPANQPPVANAGLDQIVAVSALTTLDGSGSSDPDSGPSPLSYAWSQVSGARGDADRRQHGVPQLHASLGGHLRLRAPGE